MRRRNGAHVRAVFLGAPGAGKGTQAKALSDRLHAVHVSSGDMLREHRVQGSELGRKAQRYMDVGELVPDALIIEMVLERICRSDAEQGWILDGFPRNLPQARSLDESLQRDAEAGATEHGLSHVVYFDVPHDILVRRLTGRRTCANCGAIWHLEFKPTRRPGVCDVCGGELRQRSDDRAEVVEKRLEEYRSQTEPLLDYYRARGLVVDVDADQAPAAVADELVAKLKGRAHR